MDKFIPEFEVSKKYPYKYRVTTPSGKKIYFGHVDYEHFEDKALGHYKSKNHYDTKRRRNYRARHSKILLKDGSPAYKDKEQSAYYSYYYLW